MAAEFNPSTDQRFALEYLSEQLFVQRVRDEMLSGAAGCGKSTLLDQLIRESTVPIILGAATGKAARVVSDKTGLPAFTAHKLTYQMPIEDDDGTLKFVRRLKGSLGAGELFDEAAKSRAYRDAMAMLRGGGRAIIALDEVSMLDRWLKRDLFEAITPRVQVLGCGDFFQVPPTNGRKNAGWDLQNAKAMLTKVHRQAEGSPQLAFVTHIRETGQMPTPRMVENFGLPVSSDNARVVAAELAQWHRDGKDFACLVPKNHQRVALNNLVRQELGYPAMAAGPQVGERVIVLSNNKHSEVCNGDVGVVLAGELEFTVNTKTLEFGKLDIWRVIVDAGDGPKSISICLQAWMDKALAGMPNKAMKDALWASTTGRRSRKILLKLVGLAPANAMTVHKSQGSQYPYLYILLDEAGWMRKEEVNLWYTAYSRGSGIVKTVLGRAYKNGGPRARHS